MSSLDRSQQTNSTMMMMMNVNSSNSSNNVKCSKRLLKTIVVVAVVSAAASSTVLVSGFSSSSRTVTDLRLRRIPTGGYDSSPSVTWNNNHQKTRLFATQQKQQSSATTAPSDQTWWGSFLAPTALPHAASAKPEEDETSKMVDEYLEFLDRRYNRLYSSDSNPSSVANNQANIIKLPMPFSALGWLYQTSAETAIPTTTAAASPIHNTNDDALYALGVAGLASQRLLQKRHMAPVAPSVVATPPTSSPTMAQAALQSSSSTTATTRLATIVAVLAEHMEPIKEARQRLLRFEQQKATAMVRAVFKAVPRALVRAWKLGGGGKNVAVAATLLTAVSLVLLRPMISSVLSAGASSQA
jgi:hypothetical protein